MYSRPVLAMLSNPYKFRSVQCVISSFQKFAFMVVSDNFNQVYCMIIYLLLNRTRSTR